jgi:hypothetical protein
VTVPADELVKRKRGAQAGNRNSRKPGVYARGMSPEDKEDYAAAVVVDLTPDIALIRLKVRRMVAVTGQVEDPEMAIRVVRAISFASLAITRMLGAQKGITTRNEVDEFRDWLENQKNQALANYRNPRFWEEEVKRSENRMKFAQQQILNFETGRTIAVTGDETDEPLDEDEDEGYFELEGESKVDAVKRLMREMDTLPKSK